MEIETKSDRKKRLAKANLLNPEKREKNRITKRRQHEKYKERLLNDAEFAEIERTRVGKNVAKYRSKLEVINIKRAQTKAYQSRPEIKEKRKLHRSDPIRKEARNKRHTERMQADPNYCVERRLRNRFRKALNSFGSGKKSSIKNLIGCTMEEFKLYIEQKFLNGMSWERRSEIHLDHVIPCKSFDLTKISEVERCFHYSNFQPLWSVDNLSKSDKLPDGTRAKKAYKGVIFS